jgi:hypothetical protein
MTLPADIKNILRDFRIIFFFKTHIKLERIVLLDFIHRLVSQKNKKNRGIKNIDTAQQWLGHLLPPVPDLLQGFMCVCAQVICSVVSN